MNKLFVLTCLITTVSLFSVSISDDTTTTNQPDDDKYKTRETISAALAYGEKSTYDGNVKGLDASNLVVQKLFVPKQINKSLPT